MQQPCSRQLVPGHLDPTSTPSHVLGFGIELMLVLRLGLEQGLELRLGLSLELISVKDRFVLGPS